MSLKNLYLAEGLRIANITNNSQLSGRHGLANNGIIEKNGPDESYNTWPGWMSGEHWVNGNQNATELNIDPTDGSQAPQFIPRKHWPDNMFNNPISEIYEQGAPILDASLYAWNTLDQLPILDLYDTQLSYLNQFYENPRYESSYTVFQEGIHFTNTDLGLQFQRN